MSLDTDAVDFIARERGVNPAFIEKDWYATQVIQAIASFEATTITPIFSGGTSLSKAYGIIQRFSEDLDFRACFNADSLPNKTTRRAFRHMILELIDALPDLAIDDESIIAGSNYFKCSLTYPQAFAQANALRPTLLVEFSYTQPNNAPETRSISSMVSDYKGLPSETQILCLSPIDTAADKLSALTWRVLKRDRTSPHDDPAMMRHLYDLNALKDAIENNPLEFAKTGQAAFDVDNKTTKRMLDLPLTESIQQAAKVMREDSTYQDEYRNFVDAMSYAADDDRIRFESAVHYFESLADLFDKNSTVASESLSLAEAFPGLSTGDSDDVDFPRIMDDSPKGPDLGN